MSNKAAYSALQKKQLTIPAYSVATIDYIDTQPNYFRVQNNGEAALYCATANIPTEKNYDFKVSPEGMKMFAEPFDRSKLYIYNPSGNPVNVTVLSFKAVFDPLTLALSDIEIDISGSGSGSGGVDTVIAGFDVALPAGGNVIGKVDINSFPALPTGGNHIGSVDVNNLHDYAAQLTNILSGINNVITAVDNIEISGGGSTTIVEENLAFQSIEGTATNAGNNFYQMAGSKLIKKIHYISNDGEANFTISLKSVDGTLVSMTVKPGEVVNDINGKFDMFMISGNSVPYRVAFSVLAA